MKKNYFILFLFFLSLNKICAQTTLIKEDIAIIGVNTDAEDFTFLLRTDITAGTEIYFSDNEVDNTGTALNNTEEGIVLFTAVMDYSCGTVLGFIQNSTEFTNVFGNFMLGNGGDEVIAFQGYDNTDDSWTTFLHANIENNNLFELPIGFTAADIVEGNQDNREYNGIINNPSWLQLNDIMNYNEGNNFGTVTLNTTSFICAAICTPTHTITSFNPANGPIGAHVTINGSGFTAGTTVNLNGTNASIISQSTNQLVVEIMAGASSGLLNITESTCTISSMTNFNIIENIGTCVVTSFTDIFISEVYDSNTFNNWYLELYNPSDTAINLDAIGTDFAIERYANIGGATPSRTIDLTGIINPNSVFTINLGDSADNCAFTADLIETGAGINGNDEIVLLKNGVEVDIVEAPNETGYSILRLDTATAPFNIFIPGDWTVDSNETCADIDNFTVPTPNIPIITTQPIVTGSCLDFTFSIAATPGNGGTLTYQWIFNDGISNIWQDVNAGNIPLATINGETTDFLSISGINLEGYQFYCEVTENTTCSLASNAARANTANVTWNGTNWIWNNGTPAGTPPTLDDNVVLDANFNTSLGGLQQSFDACTLTLNDGVALFIGDGDYVQVRNDLTVNNATAGGINIEPDGAFVQINDAGLVSANDAEELTVNKMTAPADNWFEYTYWSSPVQNESINDALAISNPNRRFWYNGQNFLDEFAEVANNNATGLGNEGQDDIDDNNNDWQQITDTSAPINNASILQPGVGYATTHDPAAFNCTPGPGCPDPRPGVRYTFAGLFNNGIIQPNIHRNDSEMSDNNWNLIGNPYPSAIAVNGPDGFLTQNTAAINGNVTGGSIDGAIFIWSQSSPPANTNNGNEILNFAQSDYAIINSMGSVAGGDANGDGSIDVNDRPGEFIPSGQAFLVSMDNTAVPNTVVGDIATTTVTFNNAMRTTGNNDLFFRSSNPAAFGINKLWVNLSSDNGVASETLIAYADNATNAYDGMYFDAPRNSAVDVNAVIYTTIPDNNKRFGIQAKNSNSLTLQEVIPLGFYTTINVPTIYTITISQRQGDFMSSNNIYLIDHLTNSIHDITNTSYEFTSEPGESNTRFEIVFVPEALSLNDVVINPNNLSITDLSNGNIKVKVNEPYSISKVVILDLLGRQVYNFEGNSNSEIYNISKLSAAAYIAKVTLSNGQIISKKAIKQQ